jgi:hypothetical protein
MEVNALSILHISSLVLLKGSFLKVEAVVLEVSNSERF